MKIAVVKNGIRYFRKQLDATENKDKKIYYQWEIDRLEEKLYNLQHGELVNQLTIQFFFRTLLLQND